MDSQANESYKAKQARAEAMGGRLPITKPATFANVGGLHAPHPNAHVLSINIPTGYVVDPKLIRDHHVPSDCIVKPQEFSSQLIPVAVAALESDIEMFNTIAHDIIKVHYTETKILSAESLKSIMSILCFPAFMDSATEKHGLRTTMVQIYMSII